MNIRIVLSSFILLLALHSNAQISEAQYHKIDSLFVDWNTPNHPGGAIGVMKNGKIIFSKAYGLASMEYLVPNATGTIFNTGSVSKQFTAMGIVLLQQQGKLSFDDDIRKYIPELPDFGETITIRHMLHHTSGLRSLHAMLELAGWRSDDSRTNKDLNRFMIRQHDLNFKPGDRYMYCNTGFMLMVNIIENVTGESFPAWMKHSVFEPLGMIDTYVEDDYSRIVPNNATSYYESSDHTYERAVEYWGYVGSGNMHSTTGDLLRWLSNFYEPQPGWETSFRQLQTVDKLNNGEDNNYAFGVVVDEFNGHKRIQHGGAIGGFRALVATFPDDQLNIAILTNFSASSTGLKASQISELMLPKFETDHAKTQNDMPALTPIKLSVDQLKKYEASYWSDSDNYGRKIYLRDDTLRYVRSEINESPIIPIAKDEFKMLKVSSDVTIKFDVDGKVKSFQVTVDDGKPSILMAYDDVAPSAVEFLSYTGSYYSPELETTYTIYVKNDSLFYHHSRLGDFAMKQLKVDILESEWPFAFIKFQRDKRKRITGIRVSNDRVIDLWFEKKE